jgi:hypothetical protein
LSLFQDDSEDEWVRDRDPVREALQFAVGGLWQTIKVLPLVLLGMGVVAVSGVGLFALLFGRALFWGFMVMLLAGMLYHEGILNRPMGFWPISVLLGLFVSAVASRSRSQA